MRALKIAWNWFCGLCFSALVFCTICAVWPRGPRPDMTKFTPKSLHDVAVVTWRVANRRNDTVGTGFMIDVGGPQMLVTNAHVCKGPIGQAKTLRIYNQYYDSEYFSDVMFVDEEHDICFSTAAYNYTKDNVMSFINSPAISIPSLIDGGDAKLGATYVTVGHPGGYGLEYQATVDLGPYTLDPMPRQEAYCELATQEKMSPETTKRCEMKWPERKLSEPCIGGQSGSLIMNEQAILVGILNAYGHGHCYMIPVKYMLDDLRRMATGQ